MIRCDRGGEGRKEGVVIRCDSGGEGRKEGVVV